MEKKIDYPAEITFKVVFRSHDRLTGDVAAAIAAENLVAELSTRPSRNGAFLSCTITAVFPSEEVLNALCARMTAIQGYMTLF